MYITFIGRTYKSELILSLLLLHGSDLEINLLKQEYSKIQSSKVNFLEDKETLIKSSTIIIIASDEYERFLKENQELIFNKLIIFINEDLDIECILKYTTLFMVVLPNMHDISKKGYSLICKNPHIDKELQEIVEEECINIFKVLGNVEVIDYHLLDFYNNLINNNVIYFENIIKNILKGFLNNDVNDFRIRNLLLNSMENAIMRLKLYNESDIDDLIKDDYFYNEKTKKTIEYIDKIGLENMYNPEDVCYEIKYDFEEEK